MLTKKDYVDDILKHCKTMCFYKTTPDEDEKLKQFISNDLQKIGELENNKAQQKWARIESRGQKESRGKVLCEKLLDISGLSQKEFALKYNVNESQVSRWLKGAEMQIETYLRLSAELQKIELSKSC